MTIATTLACYLLLYISSLYFSPTLARSSFKNKIQGIHDAQDIVFHDALLKQLSHDRYGNPSPASSSSVQITDPSGFLLSPAIATYQFGDNSTNYIQMYTNSTLPTSPVPSTACASALTASIACNSTVPLMSLNPFMFDTELSTVCISSCYQGLLDYRAQVVSQCDNYVISGSGNITYPPTLAVDFVIGPYSTVCLQDPSTNEYCGPMLEASNSTDLLSLPQSVLCSYCMLETLNITLSNPTMFSYAVQDLLASAVATCGSQYQNYNVTYSPTSPVTLAPGVAPFGDNSTSNSSTDCAFDGRNITTTSTTTCAAIAQVYSVSDYSILYSNPSVVNCDTIPSNTSLCIPQGCTTYTIAVNDTCDSVAEYATNKTGVSITSTQLMSFNPNLGTYCQLMALEVGQQICLGPNGGWPNVSASASAIPSATPTTYAPIPSPTVNGTTSNCGRYYQVQTGDICNTVVLSNGISITDFLLLNPEVNSNCTNLWLGYYYCVAPYPPLATVTAPPTVTTNYSSATIFSYSIPTSYSITLYTVPLTPAGVPAPTNVAQGTRTVACGDYYDIASGDTIESIANTTGLTTNELVSWNPELSSGTLPAVGEALCYIFPMGNYSLTPAPRPSNVYTNATEDCAEYYTVVSGDGCSSIESAFNLTTGQLDALNPGLKADCTNLILGDAYCVFPTYPLSQLSGGGSSIPDNVAPGTITSTCTKYYTVASGDGCALIEESFNLTSAEFFAYNPELNSNCTNLQLGYAYCVASNATSPTSPSSVPSNVAPGTLTSTCTEYHTVVAGDGCASIETSFNLTSAQFLAYNPELNSACTNLILGDAYCVASNATSSTSPPGPPANIASGSLTNCTTYHTVVSGDSCTAIEDTYDLAARDLFAWNPEVVTACTNIIVGDAYCVVGGGNACRKIYTVKSGDYCYAITQSQGITQAELDELNPLLDSNCDLIVGEILCVG